MPEMKRFVEISDEDIMALYLAWDNESGTSHASLIRAAYAQGFQVGAALASPPQAAEDDAPRFICHECGTTWCGPKLIRVPGPGSKSGRCTGRMERVTKKD